MRNRFLLFLFLLLLCGKGFAQQSTPSNKLDVTTFVVLGEGLAAGMADFALRDVYQQQSFPAQIAQQIKTDFPQPLIEPPGIGSAPGFPAPEVAVPAKGQTTVREGFPPGLFVFNLSVPGFKLTDSINRRPAPPLVWRNDRQQTVTNLILGYPALTLGKDVPLWSQLEYAQNLRPTLVLIELGYFDVLDAAVSGDPSLLPDVSAFQANYSQVLTAMTGTFANVIVTTIPNPLDTAYFTSLSSATRLVGAPASVLVQLYNLQPTDLLTVPGLAAVGRQIFAGNVGALPPGSVLSSNVASQISSRVQALNSTITSLAQQKGAIVYDLNGFFARLKNQGVLVGNRILTADFQGGIYSLDGYYPGTTIHALIANEILALLNKTFNTSFAAVDPAPLLATDPAARYTPSQARPYTLEELRAKFPRLRSASRGDRQ